MARVASLRGQVGSNGSGCKQHVRWNSSSSKARLPAVVLSVALTVALLLALGTPQRAERAQTKVVVSVLPPVVPIKATDQPPRASRGHDAPTRRRLTRKGEPPLSIPARLVEPAPEVPHPPATALEPAAVARPQPPEPPASAPARLEFDIRKANAASKGLLQDLAQNGGQQLPNSGSSPAEGFRSAVSRSIRSDCLAPNEHGSLLSPVFIAAAALSGRCK